MQTLGNIIHFFESDKISSINVMLQAMDSLFDIVKIEVEELYKYVLEIRGQLKTKPVELSLIKEKTTKTQVKCGQNLVELEKLKQLLEDRKKLPLLEKILNKTIAIFNSNQFHEGHLMSKDRVDLFTYIAQDTDKPDIGILQKYLSKVKTNIENSWVSFMQSYASARLECIALQV